MTSARLTVAVALLVAAAMAQTAAPVMAQESAADDRWTRLGRLSKTATVTVQLRDGRVLTGTIRRVSPEGLDFVASHNDVSVKVADIESSSGGLSAGKSVDLHLRDGPTISGTIVEVEGDSLRLIKADAVARLNRQEIQRIRQSVRGRSRLIGLAVGAVAGAIVGELSRRSAVARDPAVRYELAPVPAELAICGGAVGFLLGPIIRSEKTLWQSSAR